MSDDEDVPLEDLAERLGLDEEDEDGDDRADVPVDPPSPAGSEDPDTEREEAAAADASATAAEDDEPLGDLAERVRARQADRAGEESPFEAMDVGEVEGEDLWSELFERDDGDVDRYVGVGGEAERVGGGAGYDEFVVETATFCKRCPLLGPPPELHCTHEGTEILEVVDTEHFKVRECPMVEEGDDGLADI
jgi:hypothetical protein